jgi:hypothetical protein
MTERSSGLIQLTMSFLLLLLKDLFKDVFGQEVRD